MHADKETQAAVTTSAQATQVERHRFEDSKLVQCEAAGTKSKSQQTESRTEDTFAQTDVMPLPKPLEARKDEAKEEGKENLERAEREKLEQFFHMVYFCREMCRP